MPKAIWNGQVLAESDRTEVVEGNQYFPPDSINKEFFKDSSTHTSCPWKGQASYYTVVVDGKENPDAAWYYPETKEKETAVTTFEDTFTKVGEYYILVNRKIETTDSDGNPQTIEFKFSDVELMS